MAGFRDSSLKSAARSQERTRARAAAKGILTKPHRPSCLINQNPIAVRLTAGMSGRYFGPAPYVNPLRVRRAAIAFGATIIIADLQVAVHTGARAAPSVAGMRSSALEAAVIGAIDVAAVFAIEVAADAGADRATEQCAKRSAGATLRST